MTQNRRKFARQPIQLSALVHPDQGRSWLCSIRDFCEAGMLLSGGGGTRSWDATGAEAGPGDDVALHFSVASPTGQQHFRTRARIARVLDGGNGLGVVFDEGIEDGAFKALLDYAVAAGTAVPDELPEPEPEALAAEQSRADSAAKTSSGKVKSDDDAALRDSRISPKAADRLKSRILAVVTRSSSRVITAITKVAAQEFLLKARDAGTNAVQTRYFEALDSLEKAEKSIVDTFTTSLVSGVESVSDLEAALDRRRKRESGNTAKLELVDTQQFEDWLQVAEVISKAENRFKDPLLDMRAQFGLLAKPWSHKDVLPVGPAAFCWAFDDALNTGSFQAHVRKELYDLFEPELHKGLDNLYTALAKLFEDSGQMPALEELREKLQPKYTVKNRAGVTVRPQEYQEMDQAMREAVMAADGVVSGRVDQNPFAENAGVGAPVYNTARSILDIGRRTQTMLGRPRAAELAAEGARPEEVFGAEQITEALSAIQSQIGDAPLEGQGLRSQLVEVLRDRYGAEMGLTETDYDTLEVMESLVRSLSSDQLLTEGMREWVARLEVTLNKLAAREPTFLGSDPDNPHSAVQMLNQLARLGNTKEIREGIDREVGRRVDELLQRVIKDYDDNPDVFSEVVDELNPLLDRQSKTYRGNVERTVRASEGQQKLARARRTVLQEMEARLGDKEVPELLIEMLNPGWRNLLVHTHLRQGVDSNPWRDQLAVVDQVFGQLTGNIAKDSDAWVEPESLLRKVVEGLNSISFDPAKRTPLIMRMSSALVGDTTGEKSEIRRRRVETEQLEELLGLSGMLPEADPKIETSDEDVRASYARAVERARRIQVGEWLAASDRQGRPLILSVAFVGDEATSFILVNRKGAKSLERSLQEMADDLHAGDITLLEDYDLPLMERASQRMLEDMHQQLAFQASHDDLTQLMNRREFERNVEECLQRVKSSGGQHALLYMDLDQFKIINNTSGHRAGDELIRTIGEAIADLFKEDEICIARLGGDEFGVLLEDVESVAARETADRVLQRVRETKFEWEGRNYTTTTSMGLVFVDPSTAGVDELMQHADEACFSAKDAGRNRVQEYELGDQVMAKRHGAMEWVTRLDQALEEDRLILNCQKIEPISELEELEPHYEVLLTMLDELGDVVAPTELINAAETYNRMTTVDRWVISHVLDWMSSHRDVLDDFGGFSINVSGHSVNDTTFPDFVLEQFGRTQAPTAKVCFEITETAAIANLDNAIDFMNRMRIIGCSFSLDDFGTGLSSYSYLRNLPVDFVKIDGVFVRDIANNPADYAVVRSINEIGHYMGKKTIAEYVEDEKILENLKEIGVDFAQGYQVSKPCLLDDLVH
ncbi:MAG: DUF1631 family protein [Pseudomonadales bacterium]|nr:DUF1631 family protein [Pseudomonadales bacterium]